ncbi:L-type lectin-domain containing receptor kinase SIT2 [Citrus sinensis]|uniref:L-type lectin-domain containing receptor kinase SIT2 n=1 Tax=Citrus sinensis TaxID=2711 RepID=A0ACB8KD60_CITSI|nr:L-type lectin-domain containing receptor kinase SIT2 [Citrus sinensis]
MEAFSLLLHLLLLGFAHAETNSFIYNGFIQANLSLDGTAFVRKDGILAVSNDQGRILGHAFYPSPLRFKQLSKYNINNNTISHTALTFSTNFVFSIVPKYPQLGGHGLAFVLMSRKQPPSCLANQYLGLPNDTSNAKFSTRILAVEFDAVQNLELQDINDNHVGIDISSLISNISEPAAYYFSKGSNINDDNISVVLKSGDPIQAWIDYNSQEMLINVTISPLGIPKPHRPLISYPIDLATVLDEYMYVGFSASTDDILEDWEVEYGACRFRYSELYSATKGFREKNLVGSGGFGKVYRGVIPSTGLEVAIKRVAHNSRQGMKEFVAEITSMGRLRHRNLVQLHGWCRKQDELLLVYDYVPNGSLDKLLFDNDQQKKKILNWDQRYKILIGVAQALLYLHEECDQRVVHRDVKPSNVLIDADLNPKLGDFGLARAYDHNINPQTTHIVGTLGYLAPELTRTGKATTSTDVFGYGTLMLEVACGRRPIEPQRTAMELVLVEWVRELHSQGQITRAIDPTLDYFDPQEAELVLTLGLLCCDPHPDFRPSMRRVVQFLLRDASIPQAPLDIHHEFPRAIPEFSEDDSDPSSCRMTSSTSFTSFDKKESGSSQITRVTF